MHALILGGSGRTGQFTITSLLSTNHTVTALVRTPSTLSTASGLTVVQGTPTSPADLRTALTLRTPDAIIITLAHPHNGPPTWLASTVRTILNAAVDFGVKRVVYLSAAGVGDSLHSLNILLRGAVAVTKLATEFADHGAAEDELRKAGVEHGIKWTAVRPFLLTGSEGGDVKTLGERGENAGFMHTASRKGVAEFLGRIAGEEGKVWQGKTVVVSS